MNGARMLTGMILLALFVQPLHAQAKPAAPQSAQGTDEISVVVIGAVQRLSSAIAGAMYLSQRTPWAFNIPDSSDAAWRSARVGMLAIVRVRSVEPKDQSYQSVSFTAIKIRGDSLFASFSIDRNDYSRPAPTLVSPAGGGWTSSGSSFDVIAIRIAGYWQSPVVRGETIVDGGCLHHK